MPLGKTYSIGRERGIVDMKVDDSFGLAFLT